MTEEEHDLIVVGAGISGLGLAHMAARHGCRPLVLESLDRVGGALCSHRFETPQGDFWAEMGAHTCYNSYGNLLQILEDLDSLDSLQPKQKLPYRLLTQNGLRSIPSQLRMLELMAGLPRLFTRKKAGHTVADYFSSIVGAGNFRRVVGPALDAVICQDARDFPAEALFRRKPRRKEIMRNYTADGGVESFAVRIASQPALDVRTSSRAVAIRRVEQGYAIRLADSEEELLTQYLALAVAPDVASPLLQSLLPGVERILGQIGMVEIETVSVLLSAEDCPLQQLAGIIAPQDRFFSAVSRDPVPDPHYRGFSFHFRPEGRSLEEKIGRIVQVLDVPREAIISFRERHNRLPALRLGHDRLVQELDRLIAGQALALTGNWFSGVSIEDSLQRSASECQRLFV